MAAVTEAAVLAALPKYTFFESVQSAAESEAVQNTDADLLYPDFQVYYEDALDQLTDALAVAGNLELSDIKRRKALCYLIADIFLQKHPGWSAESISVSPGESISRTDPGVTDPRKSFKALIDGAIAASSIGGICAPDDDGEVLVHDDETAYQEVIEATYDPASG